MDCCEKGVYAIKKGNQVGFYCAECDEWLRWANKKERKMIGNGEIEIREKEKIKNDVKRGAVEVGFLKLSAELASELKSLGYAITHIEHGVVVSWATPVTDEEVLPIIANTTPTEEPILDKPVYTDDTLVNQPIEGEVLDNDSI